ncbi:cation:proton antiporter [Candidatus Woesearchaeota archaeon]|nr:cation:proton antiporter [Candidatus Woesearchaeota archaeon]
MNLPVDTFTELSIIILLVVLLSLLMRVLKQPLIIGYIIAGILASPFFLNIVQSTETLAIFSQIGIALLLFIVGLGLNPKVIQSIGRVAAITGIGQVAFTALVGYFILRAFGFPVLPSVYVAVALTFSSTIIIVKLLSDKQVLETLYGRISVGFLLVQDLIAILIFMFISATKDESFFSLATFSTGVLVLSFLFFFSYFLFPRIGFFIAKSQELLFIFSIGWCLLLAALFNYLGFSIEIGALLAGITLSMTPFHYEISAKLRPLRDFFLIIFFILLGAQMQFGYVRGNMVPALFLSLFVLIGNPIIMMVLMGILGYTKKTGFLAGLTVAQISEFSLILIALGVKLGHVQQEILGFVTLIGIITIFSSSYFILYAEKIYPFLAPYLTIFERRGRKVDQLLPAEQKRYDVLLFGYNRVGFSLLEHVRKAKQKYLVVDFNPETIQQLSKEGVPCKYGDAEDSELLNELNWKDVKMVISTIPSVETNLLLAHKVRLVNKDAILLTVAHQIEEAMDLYHAGVSYVLLPHFLGGEYAAMMLDAFGFDAKKFHQEKQKHIQYLLKRRELGHEHPRAERHR